MNTSPKYFDPETLAQIQPLGLRARTLVEGLIAGLHRSPLRGHSIEFAQHREYAPGDDVRQVDWKVFARSDKYYLKQYEDETNLSCYLLLDQSESMQYQGDASSLSKLEYAQLVVCSLAYLVVMQQDRVGLVTFSSEIDDWLHASSSPSQFEDMIRVMQKENPDQRTDLAGVVEQVVRRAGKPGLLVLISDMFDDMERLLGMLKMVRHAGYDAMLLHILDRDELTFPFEQMSRFEGLEDPSHLVTDPHLIGGIYRKAIARFCRELESGCQQLDMDYFCLQTDQSLAVALSRVLASRLGRRS